MYDTYGDIDSLHSKCIREERGCTENSEELSCNHMLLGYLESTSFPAPHIHTNLHNT